MAAIRKQLADLAGASGPSQKDRIEKYVKINLLISLQPDHVIAAFAFDCKR